MRNNTGNPKMSNSKLSKKLLSCYYKFVFEKLFSDGWFMSLSCKILSEKNFDDPIDKK